MTIEEAVTALDALDCSDPERAHGEADQILLDLVPKQVKEAYLRADQRGDGFWYA